MAQDGATRREVLRLAIGGTGLVLASPLRALAQLPPAAAPTVTKLSDDLFIVALPGEANVLAQTSRDGVLLVDGGSTRASASLLNAVAALPGGGPVHTLFNTHWHPEQVGSNETLGAAGRTIIAHENTRLWLTTDVTWPWNGQRFSRLPKAAQPNKTFYDKDVLPSGVSYGYIPDAAHTDGDLYVLFPQQNVLAVGDAVSGRGWPVIDYITGGWIGGIVGALGRLQTLAGDDTRIVPGRGPVLKASDLKSQYEMYGTIYDRLTRMLNKGRGPDEAVAEKPAKEFEGVMGDSDEFIRRSFESLWAYLSPDA